MSDENAAAAKVPFESLTPEEQAARRRWRRYAADPNCLNPSAMLTWPQIDRLLRLADRLVADPVPVIEDGVWLCETPQGPKYLDYNGGEWTEPDDTEWSAGYVTAKLLVGPLPSRLREANTDAVEVTR